MSQDGHPQEMVVSIYMESTWHLPSTRRTLCPDLGRPFLHWGHSVDSLVLESVLLIISGSFISIITSFCKDSCTSQAPAELSMRKLVGHHNPSMAFPVRHSLLEAKLEVSKPNVHI